MKLPTPRRLLVAAALIHFTTWVTAASQVPVVAGNGRIVTAQHLATRIGVEV